MARFKLLRQQSSARIKYLVWDRFVTDRAAGAIHSTKAETGPGTRSVTDTESKLTIASGRLTIAGGKATPAWADPQLYYADQARTVGRAIVMNFSAALTTSGQQIKLGWDAADGPAVLVKDNGTTVDVIGTAGATELLSDTAVARSTLLPIACVLRSVGGFELAKLGGYWRLVWVENSTSADPATPLVNNHSAIGWVDNLRIADLKGGWSTDYGIATQRLAGARSNNDTFTHEGNCLIDFTVTTRCSASNLDLRFRRLDATNYWQIQIDSTGAYSLYEVVAGTPTIRGTAAGVVTSGHRCVVVADGQSIKGYSNNVQRWTYASAANFVTATAGELVSMGTTGAVSDLISWPRILSGHPLGQLTKVEHT